MRALVLKELREHRWVLLGLWLLSALGLTALLEAARDDGSPLVGYTRFVYIFGVLSILTLVNRLVVREYAGRTQLFLETLPVSRSQVAAAKWLTGAALLAIPMAIAFAVSLYIARGEVLLTPQFAGFIALRAGTFLGFAYSMAFFIGLTGRYRFVIWGTLVLGAYCVDTYAQHPIAQWPPFALVSQSMALERVALPLQDLWLTGLAAALLTAATFILFLASEGALVLALSRKMSPRERVAVIVAVLAFVSLLSQMEQRKPKPAFMLHDAVTSEDKASRVAIARAGRLSDAAAKILADQMSSDLEEVQSYLTMSTLPGVFVLPDASIDSDVYLRATLPSSDGVVVRGALGAERFDAQEFRAYTLEQALDWYTRGRSQQEKRRWVSDGFTQWWIARASASRQAQLNERAALAARMLKIGTDPNLDKQLNHWLQAREQLGDCLSDALAWRAVTLLAQKLGAERFRQLISTLLGKRLPDDARAPLLETSFDEAWRRVEAPALPEFAATLQSDLLSAAGATKYASVQEPVVFKATLMGGRAFEVHYDLGAIEASHSPFAVRYAEIGAWQPELDRDSLSRVDATRAGVLPRSFQRGTLLFTAIELRDRQLACTLRLGARRWEVP